MNRFFFFLIYCVLNVEASGIFQFDFFKNAPVKITQLDNVTQFTVLLKESATKDFESCCFVVMEDERILCILAKPIRGDKWYVSVISNIESKEGVITIQMNNLGLCMKEKDRQTILPGIVFIKNMQIIVPNHDGEFFKFKPMFFGEQKKYTLSQFINTYPSVFCIENGEIVFIEIKEKEDNTTSHLSRRIEEVYVGVAPKEWEKAWQEPQTGRNAWRFSGVILFSILSMVLFIVYYFYTSICTQ
jgi:hypothetical protein